MIQHFWVMESIKTKDSITNYWKRIQLLPECQKKSLPYFSMPSIHRWDLQRGFLGCFVERNLCLSNMFQTILQSWEVPINFPSKKFWKNRSTPSNDVALSNWKTLSVLKTGLKRKTRRRIFMFHTIIRTLMKWQII